MSFAETRKSVCCFDSCPHEEKKFYHPNSYYSVITSTFSRNKYVMATTITIPPVEDYRNYMRMVLSYMHIYFGFIGLVDLPPMVFENLFTQADAQKFFAKLR